MNYSLHKKIAKTDKRQKKWAMQRKNRGFDDTEIWNLDSTFVRFIIPRLERFKEFSGRPYGVTPEQWDEIIQQMIDGFKEYRDNEGKDFKKVKKAFSLFAKWASGLWC